MEVFNCVLSVILLQSLGLVCNEKFVVSAKDEKTLATRLRQKIMGRLPRQQMLPKKEICYGVIGCFERQRKHGLKKSPQSPDLIDTKFWFYSRVSVRGAIPLPPDQLLQLKEIAELIRYGDEFETLNKSSFDPHKPLKVLIHGFKGSGTQKGALLGVHEFLMLEDTNVLVVDWEKGAADDYPTAAANTELIGRQTAVMLLDMVQKGAQPKNIHIVGFSLGAHIAGCAGDMLKEKGHKLGRITGLDPASPLFKHQFLRESSTKLDESDADFVDIIHTDGSPVFTDGFGLLRPIGHVDFFPNGGREQPGCNDGRGSVVVSTIEGTLNSSVACSHTRAWELFVESLINLQQPNGVQLRATVRIADKTKNTRGYLHMKLTHGNHSTNFRFTNEFADNVNGGLQFDAIAVSESGTISKEETPKLLGELSYQSLEFQNIRPNAEVFIGHLTVKNQLGQEWHTCQEAGHLQYIPGTTFSTLVANFTTEPCLVNNK